MTKPAKQIQSTANIKNLLQRASNIEDHFDSLREEKKDLGAQIKASGLDKRAFNVALRQFRQPVDKEFTNTVNCYLNASGQGELFA